MLESNVNAAPQLARLRTSAFIDPDFSGGTLVVSGLLAEDAVSIRNQGGGAGQIGFAAGTVWFGGVEIGTVSGGAGGSLTVTLNSAADAAAIEALIENLTYANSSGTPTASRTLTVEVTDAGGAGPSSTAQIAVNVTAENDAPSLTGMAPSVTLLENTVNAAPQLLDADVSFADPEENFSGGTLVVSGLLAEDTVSIRNQGVGAGQIGFAAGTVSFGGVAIGTVAGGAGGDLTVTFNGAADSAAIEALIENLTYLNSSEHADGEAHPDLPSHGRHRRQHAQRSAELCRVRRDGQSVRQFRRGPRFPRPRARRSRRRRRSRHRRGGFPGRARHRHQYRHARGAGPGGAGRHRRHRCRPSIGGHARRSRRRRRSRHGRGVLQGRLFTIINNGTAAAPVFNASIYHQRPRFASTGLRRPSAISTVTGISTSS